MQKYLSIVLIILMALPCGAATIYQKWDTNGWTTSIGSGGTSSVITPLPSGKHYLYADLYRNNVNNGKAAIYISLGTSAISAGTTAGNVTPFWLECDFRYKGGSTTYNALFGLFNSGGDNDNNPTINALGAQMGGSNVQGVTKDSGGTLATSTLTGTGTNVLQRMKVNVFNSGGKTLMNVYLYTINEETFEITKTGEVLNFVVLNTGESFPMGLDVLGIRNLWASASSHSQYDIDNCYFSTTSWNDYSPVPSFANLCVSAVIQAGSSYFDPWNSTRWASWYSSGKLAKQFAIDCDVTLADRGGSSSPWEPDVSSLSVGRIFYIGNCSRGIAFNGNDQYIDARLTKPGLDTLYSLYWLYSDSDRHPLGNCFYTYVSNKDAVPATVIENIWMKGCVQAIRTSSSQSHPLTIQDCGFRRNQWGIYLSGTNTTVTGNSICEGAKGGMYIGSGSKYNDVIDNVLRDNNYEQKTYYADIAVDSSYGNVFEENEFQEPLYGDYHVATKFYRNMGESDDLRENSAWGNEIVGNSVDHYSVGYEVGSRMGEDIDYDMSDEARDYAQYNLFEDNTFTNTNIAIKLNTSGNTVSGNSFSSVSYPILLHNVFFSLTETYIYNQAGTKVSYWFMNSDYTGNSDYASWFEYQNDQNGGIAVSERYTHIRYGGGTPDFDDYTGSATLLISDSQIVNPATMTDVYKSGGVPIDIAVGNFWSDMPGDEIAVIWDTAVSDIDGTDYYTIIIYDSNGMEVNRCGRSTVKWEAIAAGNFLSNKGDEIAAVHSSAVSGYYPIYIFARGRKDPLVTLYTTNANKIVELAGGNFNTATDGYDEVAAIYTSGSASVIYRKPTDTGWTATSMSASAITDIAAGNFDGNSTNGDEVAGINATSSLIYFYRPAVSNHYATAGTSGGSVWRAIAASNFGYGSTEEVAVASSVASGGVYKIYCYGQGSATAFKEINQNVLGVPANAISAGVSPARTTLGLYERAQGFTSSDYAVTMESWRNCVVVAPSAPQTTAIPAFWLNANPSDSSQKYLKVTPIVR